MKNFLKKNIITISGALLGSIAGFLYWKNVGYVSGICYTQLNPYRMIFYGAFLAGMALIFFNQKPTALK